MKGSSLKSRAGSLVCPLCEGHRLCAHGQGSARCDVLRSHREPADARGPAADNRSAGCCGKSRLRVRPPRDAAPPRRHAPLPGVRLGGGVAGCPDDPLGARGARPSVVGWVDGRSLWGAWQLRRTTRIWPSGRLHRRDSTTTGATALVAKRAGTGVIPCSCEQGRWSREPSQGLEPPGSGLGGCAGIARWRHWP